MNNYAHEMIPGEGNPFYQDVAVAGMPSVFAGRNWVTGKPTWSLPFKAGLQAPLQKNDLRAYRAPWVPHNGSVSEVQYSAPRPSNTPDIVYIAMKAPKFF